jgi:hypothetical protein
MQHLGQVGTHALALSGGEDDNVHGSLRSHFELQVSSFELETPLF